MSDEMENGAEKAGMRLGDLRKVLRRLPAEADHLPVVFSLVRDDSIGNAFMAWRVKDGYTALVLTGPSRKFQLTGVEGTR